MSIVKQTIELFNSVEKMFNEAGENLELLLIANDYESAIFKNIESMSKSELDEYQKSI